MRASLAVPLVCAAAIAVHADTQGSKRDADQLKRKIAAIALTGARPVTQPHRTTVTENEVNAYFTYDGRADLPKGIVDPTVTIVGDGRVSGRAVVDLDAVRQANNATGMLNPMSYLTGRLPVTAVGTLETENGVGRFQLESAAVGGVPLPKMMLQEIVSYYSRSPEHPRGIGLDDRFALPARIREIQVERGQAIIVQ